MRIRIDGVAEAVSVEDASDLNSLSACLIGDVDRAQGAVAPVGSLDGEHLWIKVGELKRLSGRSGDPDWEKGFGSMIDYARSKGWVNDRDEVRAHLV